MINIENLSFSYASEPVLDNISFSVKPGELLFVIGPNGAGKSTLFRCMLKFLKPKAGKISIEGVNIAKLSEREMANKIAFLPQKSNMLFSYTALDMVLMGTAHRISSLRTPSKREIERCMSALKALSIEHLATHNFLELSGGEQQLVLIARALAQGARIMVMDEPTSSLDFGNQIRALCHVKELCSLGYTILVSSHNPSHAISYATRVIALSGGKIIADGAPHEVITPQLIEALYNVKVSNTISFNSI